MESYVMITGATGGLGSAFVVDCARRGYNLFLTDRQEEGAGFAEFISQTYQVKVRYQMCDLTSTPARTELYNTLKSEGIHFWGLINVAGMDFEGAFLERTREQILTLLQLNMVSTVDTTHNILFLRDPERRFMLINVCSLAAFIPMPYKATYAATKRFLLDFSRAIREEIKDFGTVTALCPAGIPTTFENMQAIFAQGFWGKMTTMTAPEVAHLTVEQALRGKDVVIPGFINQVIQGLGSLTPVSLAIKMIARRWRTAQTQTATQRLMKNGWSNKLKREAEL